MDENSKHGGVDGAPKSTADNAIPENPISDHNAASPDAAPDAPVSAPDSDAVRTSQASTRTPFTNLSQVDADLALARTLQEQVPFPICLSISFLLPFLFSLLH